MFSKKFIPSPPVTRALQNIELAEEEKPGEDIASKRRVRIKYTVRIYYIYYLINGNAVDGQCTVDG